jgi:hypothetical protein
MSTPYAEEFAGLAGLITGAASGIGLATARLMASRGARGAILDREIPGAAAGAGQGHLRHAGDGRHPVGGQALIFSMASSVTATADPPCPGRSDVCPGIAQGAHQKGPHLVPITGGQRLPMRRRTGGGACGAGVAASPHATAG